MDIKASDGKCLEWWEQPFKNLSSQVASDPRPLFSAGTQPVLRSYGFKIYQVSFQGLFLGYVGLSNYTPIILHFRSEMKINMLLILGPSQCYLLFPVEAKMCIYMCIYIYACVLNIYAYSASTYMYIYIYTFSKTLFLLILNKGSTR